MEYFVCKVRYSRTQEDGSVKKVTESYLQEAISFSDAENQFIDNMEPYISGEYEVTDIKKVKFNESFLSDDGDRFYLAKVAFITIDEKTEKEKKSKVSMLIQSSTLDKATERIEKELKTSMIDYIIVSVKETSYMDYFRVSKIDSNQEKAKG